jgi:hypothetical protein
MSYSFIEPRPHPRVDDLAQANLPSNVKAVCAITGLARLAWTTIAVRNDLESGNELHSPGAQ